MVKDAMESLYKKEDDEIQLLLAVCFSALAYSKVGLQVFLQTASQYHSLCMLGFGDLYNAVASLAIVRVKISFAISK